MLLPWPFFFVQLAMSTAQLTHCTTLDAMRQAHVLFAVFLFGAFPVDLLAQSNVPATGQSLWEWHQQFISDPANLSGQDVEGSSWELHERAMSYWTPRLYPSGDMNIAGNAISDYLQWSTGHPKSNTTVPSNWTSMGPFNRAANVSGGAAASTGQIHAIAFDPAYASNHIMYCASGFGGMFKSTDSGANWVPLTDHKLPIAGVTDIAIDPAQPDHLFIASGCVDSDGNKPTAGVFRSFDGGATWQAMNNGLMNGSISFLGMHAIELRPGSANEMLCATSNGIYRTTNASAADPNSVVWSGPLPNTADPWYKSLVYDAHQPGLVYASGTDIRRSTDGGVTWTSLTQSFGLDLDALDVRHIAIDVQRSSPYQLFANLGKALSNKAASFDPALNTWTVSPSTFVSGTNNAPAWCCVAVNPVLNGTVAFANSEFYHNSNNGDLTANHVDGYSDEVHADYHTLAYSPDGTELWIGCDGGVYMTTDVTGTSDATTVFVARNNGVAVSTIMSISSNPSDRHQTLIGTQDDANQLRQSADSPNPWRWVDGGDGGAVQFAPDGNEAWTWIYNSWGPRAKYKKYMTNTGSSLANGHDYLFDLRWFNCQAPNDNCWTYTCPTFHGLCGAWGACQVPPMGFLPNTGQWYFGTASMYVENDITTIPDDHTDFEYEDPYSSKDQPDGYYDSNCTSRIITKIAVSVRDPNYAYFITGAGPGDGNLCSLMSPALFSAKRDGNGVMLASSRFTLSNLPDEWGADPVEISGLAVDDRDPTHIFLSFSGYNGDMKVFEGFVNAQSPDQVDWLTLDPNHSLPNLPINDMVYQEGSKGGLYVATDVGVYYKDEDMLDWQPFFTDMPNVQVNDLDINYCAGKIRAGTWGRGLWESDLAVKASEEKVISASQTWNFHHNLAQNVRVTNGATLTISSTVNFAPHTRLIIDPGAQVVVNAGGKLTNLCGEQWDGVEVRGNSSMSQAPLSNQGYLEVQAGARIEHADIAVRLYASDDNDVPDLSTTGGILKAYGQSADPVFIRNCTKGLHMLPYENRPGGGNEINNRTSLAWTVFETDENDAEYCARLEDVSGVSFSRCTFRDNASSTSWYNELRPNGIESFSAKFTVRNSTFWRLRTGIEASNDGLLNPAFIRTNTFDLCRWGIMLDGVHASEVTGNTFIIPHGAVMPGQDPLTQVDPPLGLYLHTCEGYEVEENHFTSDQEHAVGLVVTDNSSGANQFYKNTFDGLLVGSLLQGDNRDVDGQGLQCLCNDYGIGAGNVYKIAITWGGEIAQYQGQPPVFPDPAKPAGNRFYPECLAGTDASDIYVEDDGQLGFTYISHTQPFCLPDCRTPGFINVLATFGYEDDQSASPSCPSRLGHGHVINDHLLKYAQYKDAYSQLNIYLEGQLDGGDTPDLLTMINDAGISSFNLRLELLAASPKLTDRVMIAAIQRDPAMDPWHLAQVLLTNSPLTPDVMLTLGRSDVLPTYRSMVVAAQTGGLSLKSMLEAELSGYRLGMEGPRFDAVRFYLERDTVGDPLDSVLTVLGDPVVPSAAYNVACLHIARGDWSAAESVISNAENNGLDQGDIQVLQLLSAIRQEPTQAAAMVVAATADLMALTAGTTSASSAARSLLAQHAGASFEHAVVLPGNRRPRSMQDALVEHESQSIRLEAMPNPASESIRVLAELPGRSKGGSLILIDATGRVFLDRNLKPGANLLDLPLTGLANGYYRLRARNTEGVERSMSIQVSH